MRDFVLASTKEDFEKIKAALSSHCPAALTYLQSAWLSYEDMWDHRGLKCYVKVCIFMADKDEV